MRHLRVSREDVRGKIGKKKRSDKSRKGKVVIYGADILSRYPVGIKKRLCSRGFPAAKERARSVV